MNTGIEIAAVVGQSVRCVADGSIVYNGTMRGFGVFVIVDHNGYYSTYAHLGSITVKNGEQR